MKCKENDNYKVWCHINVSSTLLNTILVALFKDTPHVDCTLSDSHIWTFISRYCIWVLLRRRRRKERFDRIKKCNLVLAQLSTVATKPKCNQLIKGCPSVPTQYSFCKSWPGVMFAWLIWFNHSVFNYNQICHGKKLMDFLFLFYTRSLGALRAPTFSWRPFGPLDFVLCALRALRPVRRARWRSGPPFFL